MDKKKKMPINPYSSTKKPKHDVNVGRQQVKVGYNEGPHSNNNPIKLKTAKEMRITEVLDQNLSIVVAEQKIEPVVVAAPENCLRKEHFMGIAVEWPFPTMLKPQRQMAFSILRALNSEKHVVLESPTGTGKSAAILCSVLAWQRHQALSKPPRNNNESSSGRIKVIYCSRTHSQVAQMVSQVEKTSYRPNMTVLGSRDRMCIHQHLPENGNRTLECRERVKATEKQRKQLLNDTHYNDDNPPTLVTSDDFTTTGKNDQGHDVQPTCGHYRQLGAARTVTKIVSQLRANKKSKKQGIHDIEDLVAFGKDPSKCCSTSKSTRTIQDHAVCPYYASRALERHADLVLCPYNYILDAQIRKSLSIDLNNTVVVLDEAHNVEDTLRSSGSGQWSEMELGHMVNLLRGYANASSDYGQDPQQSVPLNEVAHTLLLFIEAIMLDLLDRKAQFEANGGARKAIDEWQRFRTPESTEFELRYDGPNGATQKAVGCQPYYLKVFAAQQPDPEKLRQYSARMSEHVQGKDDFRALQSKTFEQMADFITKMTLAIEQPQHYYIQSAAKPNGSFEYCSGAELVDDRKRKPKALPSSTATERNPCRLCNRNNVPGGHQLIMDRGRVMHGAYNNGSQPPWESVLNLELLSPAPFMKDLAEKCHTVILASGSLAPLPSLCAELGLHPERVKPNDKLKQQNKVSPTRQAGYAAHSSATKPLGNALPSGRLQDKPPPLEADHVVDLDKQLFAVAIGHMTNGSPLTVSYNQYKHDSFLDKLGDAIATVIESVPHGGVLVFLPSYSLLKRCIRLWKTNSTANRTSHHQPSNWYRFEGSKGKVIVEPTSGGQSSFEEARNEYAETIKNTGNCILFAVYRGKMSEGISFNDDNARAVLCVGIPYPSSFSRSIKAKKAYNDEQRKLANRTDLLSGGSWYSQQAYRAVAQALGRCIRHAGDYGAIFLMDSRLCDLSPCDETGLCMNHSRLPKWMRTHVRTLTQQTLHEPNFKLVGNGWEGLRASLNNFFHQAPLHGEAVLREQREQLEAARKRAAASRGELNCETTPRKREGGKYPVETPRQSKSRTHESGSISQVSSQSASGDNATRKEQQPETVYEMFRKEKTEVGQLTPTRDLNKKCCIAEEVVDLMSP